MCTAPTFRTQEKAPRDAGLSARWDGRADLASQRPEPASGQLANLNRALSVREHAS
jgi:hypothetical protein